ncbi:hypothetical protein K435DRAFT_974743 [Dendrothele bispora CBS 962.96]|uniref:Secreted protein n=1 Tax=Dendrothele bispora (strain CBS 962.96) TaxID=1314807 RepID=A0A4S8KJL8_DENBC|nr:hypothetical protein K435DRAFT_974743 [Dendrothele bispora CBS 962.96]
MTDLHKVCFPCIVLFCFFFSSLHQHKPFSVIRRCVFLFFLKTYLHGHRSQDVPHSRFALRPTSWLVNSNSRTLRLLWPQLSL